MYIMFIAKHSYAMSLVFVVKVPEGLVLAAESRKTVKFQDKKGGIYQGTYDSTPKVLTFKRHDYVGVVTCGLAAIGLKAIHSYLPELEKYLKKERLSVLRFSEKLSAFFAEQWNAAKPEERVEPISFIVAGFDKADPYGKVYSFDIPSNSKPIEQGEGVFTLAFAGQKEVTYRC
jgi:20S proteasome alpha/beta subunit